MNIIEKLKSEFPISKVDIQRSDLAFVTCAADRVKDLLSHLKEKGYRHLVMISAVDWIEKDIFQITYLVHRYEDHTDIGVRIEIPRSNPIAPGIHALWPTAHIYQRELKEMFGVDFPGSPRQGEPMMLEGWDNIPPMRKDFDTKRYSEETFFPRPGRQTTDPKQHMRETTYPSDAAMNDEVKQRVRTNRNQ